MLTQQNEQLQNLLMSSTIIHEMTRVMLASSSLSEVFNTLLQGIRETLNFERVILFLIQPETNQFHPKHAVGFTDTSWNNLNISKDFITQRFGNPFFANRHIIIDDISHSDDPFLSITTKPYVVIPVASSRFSKTGSNSESQNREIEGFLWLDKPSTLDPATGDDISNLMTLALQTGIIIDNFQMYGKLETVNQELSVKNDHITKINHELEIAQAKINKELDQARLIQRGLLPSNFPNIRGLDFAATYIPASQVGGDYYDFIDLTSHDLIGIVVADVSGHGIGAAFIMSMIKILLRKQAFDNMSPKNVLTSINQIFLRDIKTDNFVTTFYAIFNLKTKLLQYANAGHNPILLYHRDSGQFQLLKADGLFLGVFDDLMMKENQIQLSVNDRLILYTDGLTEAENNHGELFSIDKLCEVIKKNNHLNALQLKDKIVTGLRGFIGSSDFQDDVTLLIMDVLSET